MLREPIQGDRWHNWLPGPQAKALMRLTCFARERWRRVGDARRLQHNCPSACSTGAYLSLTRSGALFHLVTLQRSNSTKANGLKQLISSLLLPSRSSSNIENERNLENSSPQPSSSYSLTSPVDVENRSIW